MEELKYTVRKMKREEAPQVMDIWKETGMHQCINSLYTWHAVDPEAISVAVTDEGEIIGACSALIHHDDLAFLGMYCVRKKYRGRGIGSKVWASCMDHAGGRNVSLNAVPDKLKLYRDKCDLPVVETGWVSVVHETEHPVHPEKLSSTPPAGVDVRPLQEAHLPLVIDYDRALVGFDRGRVLELTTREPDARCFVALQDGACVGFGVVRLSCQGCAQVGPLYADDRGAAEVLLKQLVLALPEAKGLAMMTLSCNGPANEMMERIQCPASEECPRLYRKAKLDVDRSKVFAQFDMDFEPY